MKCIPLIMLICFGFTSLSNDYVGSTPADVTVRKFLGINLEDSIDFIRWNLAITDNKFQLSCNYGLCEPNTTGFRAGGNLVKLSGTVKRENQSFTLQLADRTLKILIVNNNLLQFTEHGGEPMIGNSGWSYTLNKENPDRTLAADVPSGKMNVRDSLIFFGRTACMPLEFMARSPQCRKLKWVITFYGSTEQSYPSSFKIRSTYNHHEPRTGKCAILKNEKGEDIINLELSDVHLFIKPLSADVLVFTDRKGVPLVGDRDFGFTLNKKIREY